MYRGINKEALNEAEQKGKTTRANPIRVDLLISLKMDEQITELSQAIFIEKAAAVRMLMSFALRFAKPSELSEIAKKQSYKTDGQAIKRLDTRITQDMQDSIEKLMGFDERAKSKAIKSLLHWALENIGKYTFDDLLQK